MEMNVFCNKMKMALSERMGDGAEIRISEVRKNNGILLHGVSVFRTGESITPTLYLEEFLKRYEEGEAFAGIVGEVTRILNCNREKCTFDVASFTEFSQARKRIVYKLVSSGRNEDLLKGIPYIPYLDMAIVFYYLLDEKQADGYASILIHNSHRTKWGVTTEELYSYAIANTRKLLPPWFQNMEKMMGEILNREYEEKKNRWKNPESVSTDVLEQNFSEAVTACMKEEHFPMYVLSNVNKYYGAACILYPGLLRKIADVFQNGFFILPSSVHEVILLPEHMIDEPENLLHMVREVNASEVKAEEVLSDSVYYYDAGKDKVSIFRCKAYTAI